ncbi:MAG: hypothetical protein RL355_540, partial [Actinomycetota bacterium]
MSDAQNAVELIGIWKRFPGVIANSNVNLKVAKGTVHAIVGENGAGKSTLMKILYGMQKADEGQILVSGKEQVFDSPSDAIDVGIGMVHQHFMLADNLTVLENIILGSEMKKGFRLDVSGAKKKISEIATKYGLELPLDEYVSEFGVGDRQRIE